MMRVEKSTTKQNALPKIKVQIHPLIPYNAICNQFQSQEVAIRELESELNINNSPSDVFSTLSNRELHLCLSNGEKPEQER